MIDYGGFWNWTKCILHYNIVISLWGQGVKFSHLNVTGSHNFIGSSTIKRCDFVGIGMALAEKVSHCEGGLWGFLYSEYDPVTLLTSWCLQDVGFPATTSEPCLPAHHYTLCHDDNGLNLWDRKWATTIKCFLYKGCCDHSVSSQQ